MQPPILIGQEDFIDLIVTLLHQLQEVVEFSNEPIALAPMLWLAKVIVPPESWFLSEAKSL